MNKFGINIRGNLRPSYDYDVDLFNHIDHAIYNNKTFIFRSINIRKFGIGLTKYKNEK